MDTELRYWREQFVSMLASHYDSRESLNILKLVLDLRNLPSETEILLGHDRVLSPAQEAILRDFLAEAASGTPVQYILGACYFDNMKLKVGPGVLIPRPETEELVHWIKEEHPKGSVQSICDLGTGSGCIILSLARNYPGAQCIGVDISAEALATATENQRNLNIPNLHFIRGDMRNLVWEGSDSFDLIVSNPPYIPLSESATLSEQVIHHEPHLALFTPEQDPLIFYQSILSFCERYLNPGGSLYVEVHEKYALETADLFRSVAEVSVSVRNDLQEKPRMIRLKRDAISL